MQSYYQAYQSYERRALRGEFQPTPPQSAAPAPVPASHTFRYLLGDRLVRLGLRLKGQAQAGMAFARSTMLQK